MQNMKRCSHCGTEYPDSVSVCPVDQNAVVDPAAGVPSHRFMSPAQLHCLVSLVALLGAFFGYSFWFVSGGWERREHWGEGILWGTSVVVGLWGAFDAIRLDRLSSWISMVSFLIGAIHVLSAMLFLFFIKLLAGGGPRP